MTEIITSLVVVSLSNKRTTFSTYEQWEDYNILYQLLPMKDHFNAYDVLDAIISRRIVFVREGRGLLRNELSNFSADLRSVAHQLFKYKNSDEEDSKTLHELRAAFQLFFPSYTPDVLLQDIPQPGRDEREIHGTPVIIYRAKGGGYISFEHSSAGMNDVLMLLAAIYISNGATVLVLDEISRSLHPTLKILLSKVLQASNLCIIMVTHDTEMVSEATVQHVIRLHKDKRGTYQLPAIKNKNTQFWKIICDPKHIPAFFARGILFVEGISEVRFFHALFNLLLLEKIEIPEVDLSSFHFLWEILSLEGKGNAKHGIKLMDDWKSLPHLFLLDWDNFVLSTKKEETDPHKPKKTVRLKWVNIDWNTRKSNILYKHCNPEHPMLKGDKKPDSEHELYNSFINNEALENYFVWPMDVFDIEGVCGLHQEQLKTIPFADLQEHIVEILDTTKNVGRRDVLIAFIKRLVKLHNRGDG